jgi:hypothetical protein
MLILIKVSGTCRSAIRIWVGVSSFKKKGEKGYLRSDKGHYLLKKAHDFPEQRQHSLFHHE